MSGWDAYVNALMGDKSVIQGAAIYGKGATPGLWASSPSFIKSEEIAALSKALTDEKSFNEMSSTGFTIGGVKFMKINSEANKIIRGKKGEMAAAAALSEKAIIVATGKGSPQDVSTAVEKMAADLSSKGF
jgi:hypothetical protein